MSGQDYSYSRVLRSRLMPTDQILALLIAERDKLTRAIEALQGPAKRRGRPSKNAAPGTVPTMSAVAANGRRGGMSSEARKAQSARMKAYWAKRRKQATAKSK